MYVIKQFLKIYVRYGKESDNLVVIVIVFIKMYEQKDMCYVLVNILFGW